MTHPESQAELAACPFCGGEAILQEHEPHSHAGGIAAFMPDYPGSFTIECCCTNCNTGQIADTRAEVVAMWNRRAAQSPVVGASELPTKEELRQAIYDKVSRAEDLMTDVPPHNAVARYHEASKTLHDIIDQLFPAAPQPPKEAS